MTALLAMVLPWVVAAVLVGALGLALAARGLAGPQRRARWLKFGVYLLVIAAELLLAAAGGLVWLALPLLLLAAAELRSALAAPLALPLRRLWRWGLPLLAPLPAVGLLGFCLLLPPLWQLLVVLEVLAFDGFSQVSGQLLGRHALVPRLSPAKTWEGLLGGVAACLALALALRAPVGLAPAAALLQGAFTASLALAGDLAASALKRRCGLKDFSRLIPGHGGVLDRFDSLLAAASGWCLLALLTPWARAPVAGG